MLAIFNPIGREYLWDDVPHFLCDDHQPMTMVDPVGVATNDGNTVLMLEQASENWKRTP